MRFFLLPLLVIIGWHQQVAAQHYIIKGKITDEDSKEALVFVNIAFNNTNNGTTSNIDGFFRIETSEPLTTLTFRYVGYNSKTIVLHPDDFGKDMDIKLSKRQIELAEVKISPTENPAHRIIKKVLENRDMNNPERLSSFSYKSYNKMFFTLQQDTLLQRKHPMVQIDSVAKNSPDARLSRFLNRQHIFLMEFVSQHYFKHPDKNSEEVISSRVSGFSDPSFTLLGTQMQSFGFYTDMVTLMEKQYLNPISRGSTKKYFFLLQDTFLTETMDTLFVISYRPKRGTNFEGLQGMLYINTNGYAIQNVIAEPYQSTQLFAIKIQQRYEFLDHKQWFPTQLNTDLLFKGSKIKTKMGELFPVGIGKNYLSEIKLEPDVSNVKFSSIEIQVADNAHKQKDTLFNYRRLPLTARDSATYRVIDSLGRAEKFDQKLRFVEAMMSGYIPYKIFNIDWRKIFSYNNYEGARLGLGLATNHKLASFFSVGGYFAYGCKDEDWKYGASLQLFRNWISETKLTIKYSRDVRETGQYTFFEDNLSNSSEWYRDFMIRQMDMIEEKEMSLSFRTMQYFKFNVYLNQSRKQIVNYSYLTNIEGTPVWSNDFRFTEAGISVKVGYKEKFMLTPSKRRLSLGTSYPMLWFNLKRGLNTLNGQFECWKYELKASKKFTTRRFGKSLVTLVAGKVDGKVPICNLYEGHGSYTSFGVEAENSFGTMRLNEFYSNQFVSLFLKQDFGTLLFSTPKFKPEICLVTNVGYGKLLHPEYHQLVNFKTLEKGYYESGLLINKLLNNQFSGLGFGVFYRYGAYGFAKTADNFAYKMTLTMNL